ncbi:Crp/Fnr family transcriptional regulator [Brevibacillus daliensis]|uniref:Crp/Fnr family transcriptional regulator n=1 Tax=Brevibacillus daliensis TaxID=2892995 RepID=UPI002104BF4E
MGHLRTTFTQQVSPGFIEYLTSISTQKKLPAGSVLFMDGDKADHLYLIRKGQIKLTKTTTDGKELILQIFGPSELIGVPGLFEENLSYTTTATIMKKCVVDVFSRSSLERFLLNNGQYCAEFLRWMGIMNRRIQSKFRDLLLNGKTGALYSTLIRLSNSYGQPHEKGIYITLSLTNKDLAQFIGLTRESVNRMLADLKKQDIIEQNANGNILIKDLQYLRDAIFCDDCPHEICQL